LLVGILEYRPFAKGAGRILAILSRQKAIVNGSEAACVRTPSCVPPRPDTVHCFAFTSGAWSTETEYVGEVKPAWAEPVTGDESDVLKLSSNYFLTMYKAVKLP
jgi:hypothetical protein